MGDDDRNAILRRRRFFIATAVAGLAATQCDKPKVCLNISEVTDGGSTVAPTVCLSPPPIPPEASMPEAATPDASTDASSPTDAGSDAKRPTTLAPPITTRPLVCLTPIRKPSER
jgi:hypothetical protein